VEAHGTGSLITAAMAIAYIVFMIVLVRPTIVRLTLRQETAGRLTQGMMAVVFVLLLLSALTTDLIGIHAMFGAFALGAVIPSDSKLAHEMTERLEDVLVVLLLPTFFAFTGLRTRIGLVSGLHAWLMCALTIAVASVGKFGGSFVAARLTGLGWRDASALGVLMNTRGMAELIVLNIGLQLRVINPRVFAMLVVMSLVTTLATSPILHLIRAREMDAARTERDISWLAWLRTELHKHVDLRGRSLGGPA
jgi:Kef-type K+ transport system membrane component KefB